MDDSGQTPLHIAVVREDFEIASLLLKYSSCKPNLQDNDGNTALSLHLGVGSLFAVTLFLSHTSIDLNIQNSAGNTPLHEAVERGASCDVVKALVLHKCCDPNIVNKAGKTPLQYAIIIGASVSEPPLVDSKDALSRYINTSVTILYMYYIYNIIRPAPATAHARRYAQT